MAVRHEPVQVQGNRQGPVRRNPSGLPLTAKSLAPAAAAAVVKAMLAVDRWVMAEAAVVERQLLQVGQV
ncbi:MULTISPECIES: hypothetical protein [unclassified Sphingomonas]|uniref:hypothetical protein n=1 Tax=Sphingomonas sp. PvP015 TaxID=3156388 RepID=UPI0033908BAE